MNRSISIIAIAAAILTGVVSAGSAVARQAAQGISDIDRVEAASQRFVAAISGRDIRAMDNVWAHDSYVTFAGPLSTTLVVGWDGVRKAWEMRFSQFDHVAISLAESRVRVNGNVAWSVGIEKVQLLRRNGQPLEFDAFVTNVFEKRDNRWLVVSHQATPIFRETP
jgi:ketosteroid isomerase-like protein